VLVTGPTGSGKTTTLYSALARIDSTTTNVMTVEDLAALNAEGVQRIGMGGFELKPQQPRHVIVFSGECISPSLQTVSHHIDLLAHEKDQKKPKYQKSKPSRPPHHARHQNHTGNCKYQPSAFIGRDPSNQCGNQEQKNQTSKQM
jgi:energy-coupling factor transporter ATP-binding protein EcfA2